VNIFNILIISLLIQVSAYFATYIVSHNTNNSIFVLLSGLLIITVTGFLFKLERRWILCNLSIPLALFTVNFSSELSSIILYVAPVFILLYLPTFWSRVPYYPTHKKTYLAIEKILDNSKSFTFLDAGCGDGKLLCYLSKKFPTAKFCGLEISPLSFLIAYINSKFYGSSNLTIRLSSFWNYNYGNYDYVYVFLAPPPMPKIKEKALKEMKSGQTLIVNSFPIEHKATEIIDIPDYQQDRSGTLYVYRF
jgi:hypothetical protein